MSKECGVSMINCFWCGENVGVAIPTKISAMDNEPCNGTVMNYDFCDKCKKSMAKGVTLIEMSPVPMQKGQPEMDENSYPTGRYWVVKRQALTEGVEDINFITQHTAEEMGFNDE